MLVLTRREGESTVFRDSSGREIGRVVVASIRGQRVRIAFEGFDRDVAINRAEVDAANDRAEREEPR